VTFLKANTAKYTKWSNCESNLVHMSCMEFFSHIVFCAVLCIYFYLVLVVLLAKEKSHVCCLLKARTFYQLDVCSTRLFFLSTQNLDSGKFYLDILYHNTYSKNLDLKLTWICKIHLGRIMSFYWFSSTINKSTKV
jgi:hypothetical protein